MHPGLSLEISITDDETCKSPSPSSFKKPVGTKSREMEPDEICRVPGKRISFGKRVKVKKIRSYKIYSEEEYNAVWHSEEEYADIKRGCIRTLRQMMNPKFQEDEECCPRGLEVRTKEASWARKEARGTAVQMVIEEQELQLEWGVKNDERIRQCYLEISKEAHARAHSRGLSDAKVSKEYLRRR